jgi:hypothetical protein
MRIIKEGIDPLEMIYRATCTYCKTEIEFARKEANVTYDQREGDWLSVQCPLCKNSINCSIRY